MQSFPLVIPSTGDYTAITLACTSPYTLAMVTKNNIGSVIQTLYDGIPADDYRYYVLIQSYFGNTYYFSGAYGLGVRISTDDLTDGNNLFVPCGQNPRSVLFAYVLCSSP